MQHAILDNGVTETEQDRLFCEAIERFGGALARMARGYEANPEVRRDLEQELQVALWQSFERFDGRCSLSTWIWRVAHNRAISFVVAQKRHRQRGWSSIEELEISPDAPSSTIDDADERDAMARILAIIDRLDPPDRQIMLLYLEGVSGADIADITGVTSDAVATKIHRFKAMLTRRFAEGGAA